MNEAITTIPASVISLATSPTRHRLELATLGSLLVAALDVTGVALIVPLTQLLTDPDNRSGLLKSIANLFGNPSQGSLAIITAGIITVIISWTLIQTLFTLRYADLYYAADPPGGMSFNSDQPPDFRDFAYVSFTVGMSFNSPTPNCRISGYAARCWCTRCFLTCSAR